MKTTLTIIQIVLSVLLVILIFLQSTGDSESGSLTNTVTVEKRGWEKVMFNFTIFIVIVFIISSIIQTLI